MASLYKKPVMVRDPETGERVKGKSRKWWGRFRDEHGIERRVPLASDRRVAQAMLVKTVKRSDFLEYEDEHNHFADFQPRAAAGGGACATVEQNSPAGRHWASVALWRC